jgi:hypothetical protein
VTVVRPPRREESVEPVEAQLREMGGV